MTPQFCDGMAVCLIIIAAVGTTILALDAWGNRHPKWVDKQIDKIKR